MHIWLVIRKFIFACVALMAFSPQAAATSDYFSMPTNLTGPPGGTVVVPVHIEGRYKVVEGHTLTAFTAK